MIRDMARPYTPLRAARIIAPPSAAAVVPPAAMTLTALNCEAPVNTSSDMAQAWATDPPADTAPTPNATPNTPTTAPSVALAITTGRRSDRSSACVHAGPSVPEWLPIAASGSACAVTLESATPSPDPADGADGERPIGSRQDGR